MARKKLAYGFFLAFSAYSVSACERAGASYGNRTDGTAYIKYVLKPEELPQGFHSNDEPIALGPDTAIPSVWRVDEYRLIEVRTASGKLFRFEGASLKQLALRCPKRCSLRITEGGVAPFREDFVGETAL